MTQNPIAEALDTYGVVTLDGALATVLELRGCNLKDKLWSAKVLLESPELIYKLHYDYFVAGARCISTASYQATPKGFYHYGIGEEESIALIKLSATLARRARDDFLGERNDKPLLLISGSVGPYGAYLSNGAEYRGDYSLPESEMMEFHRPRVKALIESGVDVLAFETIPSFDEAKALVKLIMNDFPDSFAWLSFTLRDPQHISDGTPLDEVAAYFEKISQIAAIGINCIRPEFVTEALKTLNAATRKPLIVYPNSGELYDEVSKTWKSSPSDLKLSDQLGHWYEAGARLIGGCCRSTPDDVTLISHHFSLKKIKLFTPLSTTCYCQQN